MPTVPLPDEPSFAQLRKQAKDLQRAVRAQAPGALAEVAEHGGQPGAPGAFPLAAAQFVVARRYGFASWARLKRHVAVIERYSRYPDLLGPAGQAAPGQMPAGHLAPGDAAGEPAAATAALAEDFLRLACLAYGDDQPERWQQAARILAEHPEIAGHSSHAAAAAADAGALRRILAADPAAASREGGPYRWEPLLYLAYARHDPAISKDAVLGSTALLLDAGADPNAGYLWHGLTSPFTVLTGVLGEGELGPVRQPRHPHWQALARLLLAAGAEANDPQGLYNRMFEPGTAHLALLFEFGLGTGDGGPWRRRLGGHTDPPEELVRGQLGWAITHGMTDRVHLIAEQLAERGADLAAPLDGGVTAATMAATTGHADLVDYLVARGSPAPELAPAGAFVAAALAADRAKIGDLLAAHPGLAAEVRAARPALIVWAAACGQGSAVELLAGLGFDVNAKGRSDVPSDQPWQTALHKAAEDGNAGLARTLLALGADPDIRDARFGGTPLGWARYFGQQPLIDLLEPVTAE